MTKKYELIDVNDSFYRIRALIDIPRHGVKAGDLGGRVQSESNLSHEGDCWIEQGGGACQSARIKGNAILQGRSIVSDYARVSGSAIINSSALYENSFISGNAVVTSCCAQGSSVIRGNARIKGLFLKGRCNLYGDTFIEIPKGYINSVIDLQGEYNEKNSLAQGPALSSDNWSLALKTPDGIIVTTGCFRGTLDEYLRAIEDTHKDSPKYLKQYREFHANFVNYFSQ